MTKTQRTWMTVLVLVLAASCYAAEQPVVWYPAQQAADGQTSSSQTTAPQQGQQPGTTPPAGTAQPATNSDDPRVLQPMQPMEAISSSVPAGEPAKPADTAPALLPDTTPLNTPQALTLGTPSGGGRNYFLPSMRFTQYEMLNSTGTGGWSSMALTNLSGSAEILHSWSRSSLKLDYTGGGNLYPSDSSLNSAFQQLGLELAFNVHRLHVALTDQANYLPESAFGYFGLGMGTGGAGLGSQFLPNQSFLSDTSRISNVVASTVTYPLSAKSSLHFYGTYSLLRFQGNSGSLLVNSNSYGYSAGYDHTFGRNTVGLSYVGSMFSYGGSNYSIRTDGVDLSFGRKITGRLAWQIGGGPIVNTVQTGVGGSNANASWNLNSGLTYQLGRTVLNGSFARNVTAGAGVFAGAETYEWLAGVSRQVGRQWSGNVSFGIARNNTLQQTTESHYQTEFVMAQLSRVITHEISGYLNYNFQHQATDFVICPGCGDTFERHVFGIGFQWQSRPLAFSPF